MSRSSSDTQRVQDLPLKEKGIEDDEKTRIENPQTYPALLECAPIPTLASLNEITLTLSKHTLRDVEDQQSVNTKVPVEPYPTEGIRNPGWLVVFSAFLVNFFVFGTIFSWGNFQRLYLNEVYPGQTDEFGIAFVGTSASAVLMALGLFMTPIIRAIGFRGAMAIGTILCPLGLILASFSTQLWQLYLTQGILFGIGGAFCFSSCITLPSQWFVKKRAFATGIGVSGSGAGGIALSPMAQGLISTVGYRNALRAMGGLGFALLSIATVLALSRWRPPSTPDRKWWAVFDISLIDRDFGLLLLFTLFVPFGYIAPFFLTPTYAAYIGVDAANGATLVSIMSATNAISRILLGYVGDKFGRINTLTGCTLLAGKPNFPYSHLLSFLYLTSFLWQKITGVFTMVLWQLSSTYPIYVVYALLNGLSGGGFVSLLPAVTAEIVGIDNIQRGLAMAYLGTAAGSLLGTPIAGLLQRWYGWTAAIQFAGAMSVAAGLVGLVLRMLRCQAMDQHPDAFAKTLNRQRSAHHAASQRDGSVNRLSRVFEQSSRGPVLPAKPPSLRLSASYQHQVDVPSQTSLPAEDSPAAGIDQTSLAFNDIRAKFQKGGNSQKPMPKHNPISVARVSATPTSPPPIPQKTGRALRNVAQKEPPVVPAKPGTVRTSSCATTRTNSFVAELSQRLEQTETNTYSRRTSIRNSDPRLVRQPSNSSLKNVPSNNTSSSLHIPFIARTLTGTSTTSTSSTSSTATSPSKRAWQYGSALTSWLTGSSADDHQHNRLKGSITVVSKEPMTEQSPALSSSETSISGSLPVSPQLSGKDQQKVIKRSKVMQELLETEKVYQRNMILLKEVYYDQACAAESPLQKADVKTLFANLLDIVDLEETFVTLLEDACPVINDNKLAVSPDDHDDSTVGMVFREMMGRLDEVYCEYCKRHEDAVLRMQELENVPSAQAFFMKCNEQMQGQTGSWDLGSLLIRPVQRVLKYPLLLREIFLLTPANHPDHENLSLATKEIQEVADHINEIKRRKDIVERIVGDKKKTDINKFRQVTGFAAEATQDALFDALQIRFEEQQEVARQLARDVQKWVRQVKDQFDNLQLFASSMENIYSSWGGVRVRSMESMREFTKATSMFSMIMSRELDTMMRGYVYSRIDSFLRVFENPSQVISKRAQKLLDYDRVRGIKSKGDTPDKALQESADAYVSINAQLVDELPRFFVLTARYFDILVGELAMVQTQFHSQLAREWRKLVDKHFDGHHTDMQGIIAKYISSMECVQRLIDDITPINKTVWETVPGATDTPSIRRKQQPDYFGPSSSSSMSDDTSSHRMTNGSLTQKNIETEQLAEPMFECVLLYDYEPQNADELCVRQGDTILVWDKDGEDTWWYGSLVDASDLRYGWVPAYYCQKV
ncbi:hypothetical protein EC973_002007 [Apophysomyces ossiformis]|uniref:Dynamin-binding protein n=1 Tax=Apophysomyces ossiformis TaxID=679940 RepID=A0A8H7EM07_9FUNG|nr:hypothetical protein EC973_002007 [Apophysomyces ossiformis]